MKKSAAGSVAFHAAIILAALVGLPAVKPFEITPTEAIQVDISNISDMTKIKALSKSEETPIDKPKPKAATSQEKTKPQEKIEEKKLAAKEPVAEEPPPPEPEKKVEPPPPEKAEEKPLDSDPLKELLAQEQKLEEEKKQKKEEEKQKKLEAEKKKKADEKKKLEAEKKKKAKEQATLQAMIDKSNDEASSELEKKDESGTPEKSEKDVQGSDDALAATLIDALRQKLSECWTVPPGAREASVTVKIKFSLNQDGSVNGLPVIVGGGGGTDALYSATAQSAISAVMECQNYDFLPRERFDMWQNNTVNFTPDMMSGT